MIQLKPSVKAYDFVYDIQSWLKRNKLISSCKVENALSEFFTKSNFYSMSNGCLFNFYFPEDESDYRFNGVEKELREELQKIFSIIEKEIGKSEIKVYFWW